MQGILERRRQVRRGAVLTALMVPAVVGSAGLGAVLGDLRGVLVAIGLIAVAALTIWTRARAVEQAMEDRGGIFPWFRDLTGQWFRGFAKGSAIFLPITCSWQLYRLTYSDDPPIYLLFAVLGGLVPAAMFANLIASLRASETDELRDLKARRRTIVAAMPVGGRLLRPFFFNSRLLKLYLSCTNRTERFVGRETAHAITTVGFVGSAAVIAFIFVPVIVKQVGAVLGG